MTLTPPHPQHLLFRTDLIAVLRKHAGALNAVELLAVAAHLTGQILALQDQRTMSPSQAMDIVAANIELGNRDAIGELFETKGVA